MTTTSSHWSGKITSRWYLDNVRFHAALINRNDTKVFSQPFFMLFNLSIGGDTFQETDVPADDAMHFRIETFNGSEWVDLRVKRNGGPIIGYRIKRVGSGIHEYTLDQLKTGDTLEWEYCYQDAGVGLETHWVQLEEGVQEPRGYYDGCRTERDVEKDVRQLGTRLPGQRAYSGQKVMLAALRSARETETGSQWERKQDGSGSGVKGVRNRCFHRFCLKTVPDIFSTPEVARRHWLSWPSSQILLLPQVG